MEFSHSSGISASVSRVVFVDLQSELEEVMKQHSRVDKELSAALQENKRMSESLQEAQEKLPQLQKQLEEFEQAKAMMAVRSLHTKHHHTLYYSNSNTQ